MDTSRYDHFFTCCILVILFASFTILVLNQCTSHFSIFTRTNFLDHSKTGNLLLAKSCRLSGRHLQVSRHDLVWSICNWSSMLAHTTRSICSKIRSQLLVPDDSDSICRSGCQFPGFLAHARPNKSAFGVRTFR